MAIDNIIGEIHNRLRYQNWYVGFRVDNEILIITVRKEFYEKYILKQIMKQYDCEYRVNFLDYHSSLK